MPALHREATMLRLRAYDLIQNGCHKAVDSILQPSDPKPRDIKLERDHIRPILQQTSYP